MLAKCANPICGAHFRYLSQGRVFYVPVYGTASKHAITETTKGGAYPQRVEHYWLCAECLMTMTLVLRNGEVTVRQRFAQLTDGKSSQTHAPERIPAAA
jgi:hypothetical protein